MIKKSLLLLACLITTITVAGTRLSPEQACRAAQRFIDQNVTLRNHASQVTAGQVKAYRPQPDGKAMVYAVNLGNDRGFVLVGGQADEIIGYCDHGEFDAELMPANMRLWLDSYMAAAQQQRESLCRYTLRSCPRQTHCHFGVKVAAACIQRYQVQLTHSRGNEAISC